MVKDLPAVQETWVPSLEWRETLEKEMATCASILDWEILWTEEPGVLQSIGSQRVRHDWGEKHKHTHMHTHACTHTHTVIHYNQLGFIPGMHIFFSIHNRGELQFVDQFYFGKHSTRLHPCVLLFGIHNNVWVIIIALLWGERDFPRSPGQDHKSGSWPCTALSPQHWPCWRLC